ncbi:MAG: 8-oxo-dGTP diphosphatase MutT [Firmicutes bacterium HGW-Firmicutes-12]|jgi:8-oxo-dGTP diphosphatase|nr:MAG: 8-oxo-dGTP diphosphatase MutT [Firmicutes bacterium HGW-Firmicutes-12]
MKKVTAALIMHNGRVLIAKRKADDKLANKWEFPGGKVEFGETPEECLIREIKEELDIEIIIDSYFAESVYTYPHGTIHLMAYWAKWISGTVKPTVHDDIKWAPPEELPLYDFAPADIAIVEKLTSGL